jgi:hypothetical protein
MAEELRLAARDRNTRKPIAHKAEPAGAGIFRMTFTDSADVTRAFESGNVEIRALDRTGEVLGSRPIARVRGRFPIALKLRVLRPATDRAPAPPAGRSNAIISDATVHRLARNLARLQGVGFRTARAPRRVVQAIAELNHVAEVAAYSRIAGKAGEAALRNILSSAAFASPGGSAGDAGAPGGGFGGGSGPSARGSLLDGLGELQAGFRCGPALTRAASVLDSAFRLDLSERNVTPRWTEQAHAYVGSRMRDVSGYVGSTGQAQRGRGAPGRPGGDFPPGEDDLTAPVYPPGVGGEMPPPPADPPDGGFGSDFCAQITDLCLALYAEVLAAQLRDTYTDLIATVEPNCLCSTYDPNQVFIARPQPGQFFPAPLPAGVLLYFRNQVITPLLVTPDEIHLQIPPNAQTGFVLLRAIGSLPSQASRQLNSACALVVPEIPFEILLDRAPAALITIVYPPVIASLTSDNGPQPAEACTPVEISWRVHLLDQPASAPLPPCASIEAILRDDQGNQIAVGGAAGEVLETRAETTTYTLEAISRAGATPCGSAAPISQTVTRVHYVRLERPGGVGMEHRGGANGQFTVRISCPAPTGGQLVALTSSDPTVLQVPSPVTIPAGTNSLLVEFATVEACVATPVRVTAASASHTPLGDLEFLVYGPPALQWAAGPPAYVQESGPFSAEVDASCVPDDSSRVQWWLIWAEAGNPQAPILLNAQRVSGQYPALRFRVELPSASAGSLIPGRWELVVEIPDRSNVRSPGLGFAVSERPRFTMSLTSPMERTIVWDEETEYSLSVTGQNIPPNLSAAVAITPQGLSSAFMTTAVPVTLTQANSGQPLNAALRILSPAARGPVGTHAFRIVASATGVQAPPAVPAAVTVKRMPGAFTVVQMRYNSMTCTSSGRSVTATVGGNGMTRTVEFAIPGPNRTIRRNLPAVFYAMSPKCRVAVVIPPVMTGTGPTAVDLVNIGFEAGTGARAALGDSIDNLNKFWQRFWFSQDDTLMVIIGRVPRGVSTSTHVASLHDMMTGRELDSQTFSPAIQQSADDPSPLLPPAWMTNTMYAVDARVTHSALTYRCLVAHTSGVFATDLAAGKWVAEFLGETEIELAVITSIVLTNQASGDVVTVNYTNQTAAADSLTLDL